MDRTFASKIKQAERDDREANRSKNSAFDFDRSEVGPQLPVGIDRQTKVKGCEAKNDEEPQVAPPEKRRQKDGAAGKGEPGKKLRQQVRFRASRNSVRIKDGVAE